MTEKNNDVVVEVEFDGAIEKKVFDISSFVGKSATIESVETKFNEKRDSYYLLVKTVPVSYVDDKPDRPVTASRIYSLISDNGKFGWRKDGDLDLMLKEHKVENPTGLKGKTVILFPSKPNAQGVKFLTF